MAIQWHGVYRLKNYTWWTIFEDSIFFFFFFVAQWFLIYGRGSTVLHEKGHQETRGHCARGPPLFPCQAGSVAGLVQCLKNMTNHQIDIDPSLLQQASFRGKVFIKHVRGRQTGRGRAKILPEWHTPSVSSCGWHKGDAVCWDQDTEQLTSSWRDTPGTQMLPLKDEINGNIYLNISNRIFKS